MLPDTETLIERNRSPKPVFSLSGDMWVERGAVADWDLLHELHYKAENLPMGPHFWKLTLGGDTIGVLVSALPKGMLRERHLVFPNAAPGAGETRLTNTMRYKWLNQNMRVVSRFVIDTQYRGIGAGYRMMNLVSRMTGLRYMEIQSSMSKFNTFGQRAGFRFVAPQNARNYEKVMKFLRGHFTASPQDFEAMVEEMAMRSPAGQQAILDSCREFYMRNSALENTSERAREQAERRVAAMDLRATLRGIQAIGLASPMYGVWGNPDLGRGIPQRLPLSAFDAQGPTEAFRYE
jgi:hypothetical protein